jgi:hypothetical protein
MMGVAQSPLGSTKQVMRLGFAVGGGLAANATLGTVPISASQGGTLGVNEYTMPWDGSIIAVAGRLGAAITAGTLTLQPRIDGSLANLSDVNHVNSSDIRAFYKTQEARTHQARFSAGQHIGLSFTTTSDWAPGTVGVEFDVYVLLDGVQY